MRKLYWYATTYVKKHGLTFFISVISTIAIFSILIPLLATKISIKQRKHIGIVGGYNLYSLPDTIKHKISSGLTKANEDQTIVPLLSERWSVEDEGKTYRFIIKKDILWQDGQPVTPENVKYNFRDVETVTNPNDVIFKLPDSFAPFPSVVTEPLIRIENQKYLLFFKRPMPIGIGPQKVISYQTQGNKLKEITIDGDEEVLIYRFYLTESEAINAFKKGEVDVLENIKSNPDILNWDNVEVNAQLQKNSYLAVFFNNTHPNFSKNVRQALSYALEKPDDETRALGPIDPRSWAYLPGGKSYKKDLDRAVERILDAIPPEKMELELTTTYSFIKEAEQIKTQWEEFGQLAAEECQQSKEVENKDSCQNLQIKVNIKVANFPDTNNYQLLLFSQDSPPDPDQYFLWHSEQSTNFTRYKNTRIDSLLEKGRKTFDTKERLAIYQEFQQFLLEDPPAIFLKHLYIYQIKRK